jgi:DNA-binding XRE family transcriptional regulator
MNVIRYGVTGLNRVLTFATYIWCTGVAALSMPLAVQTRLRRVVQRVYIWQMKLSDWMTTQGLDDEQLGNLVQADRVTISRIRRGLNRPSWDLAGRIKKASNGAVGADDFLPPLKAAAS